MSKYYQDILPDGCSSPVSSNGNWKISRVASPAYLNEIDNAGVVVVKGFVTNATIAQFRAHSSPISALCFDPSGTLLVTASVHGNSINVFRIMPSNVATDANVICHDLSMTHVHLFCCHTSYLFQQLQSVGCNYLMSYRLLVVKLLCLHILLMLMVHPWSLAPHNLGG